MRDRVSPSPFALAACAVLMGSSTCVEAFSECYCFTLQCRDCRQNWVIWPFERNDSMESSYHFLRVWLVVLLLCKAITIFYYRFFYSLCHNSKHQTDVFAFLDSTENNSFYSQIVELYCCILWNSCYIEQLKIFTLRIYLCFVYKKFLQVFNLNLKNA